MILKQQTISPKKNVIQTRFSPISLTTEHDIRERDYTHAILIKFSHELSTLTKASKPITKAKLTIRNSSL